MEYLLAWRIAMAKELLRRGGVALAEVAERVGYSSASTFSAAFSRHVGQAPGQHARQQQSPFHRPLREETSQRVPASMPRQTPVANKPVTASIAAV